MQKIAELAHENAEMRVQMTRYKEKLKRVEGERDDLLKGNNNSNNKGGGQFSLEDMGKIMAAFMKNTIQQSSSTAASPGNNNTEALAAMMSMFSQVSK